ncbi:beta-1,3-galactosyltransferase 5-like [Macrobrachium rosenbergii]|uniref:beta-1,3-galactosyltransferase 5-like n=1 Tax=Macrobrachium rosenbergii TaxID=79674 RepID=UPI0034D481C1
MRRSTIRITYSLGLLFGLILPLSWMIAEYLERTSLSERSSRYNNKSENKTQGNKVYLPRKTGGVDIVQFDFQAAFVREENEVENKFPEENSDAFPHKHKLRYLIEEPNLCDESPDLHIISYVHSAVHKKENRQLVRNTWGNMKYYPQVRMKVIFVFGAAATKEEQKIISEESEKYHDIIQTDFVDTYKNLSYKGVSALQWVSQHCMHPKWILKSDDDMIINIFALVDYLKAYTEAEAKQNSVPDKIVCAVWWGMPVLRGKGCAKWCVTEEEWKENTYPAYCSGSAFVIPTHRAPDLYHAYYHAPFLWVDDAYISGVLAKQAGVQHKPVHSLYELNHFLIEKNMVQGNRIFCHHPGVASMREKWWPKIVSKEVHS